MSLPLASDRLHDIVLQIFKFVIAFHSVPGPVGDLDIVIDNDDVIITWSPPNDVNGDLLGYNLTYQKVATGDCDITDKGPVIVLRLDADDDEYEIDDLEKWSQYKVTIAAINAVGEGDVIEKDLTTSETGKQIVADYFLGLKKRNKACFPVV